jgi:hypothetical protein
VLSLLVAVREYHLLDRLARERPPRPDYDLEDRRRRIERHLLDLGKPIQGFDDPVGSTHSKGVAGVAHPVELELQ